MWRDVGGRPILVLWRLATFFFQSAALRENGDGRRQKHKDLVGLPRDVRLQVLGDLIDSARDLLEQGFEILIPPENTGNFRFFISDEIFRSNS